MEVEKRSYVGSKIVKASEMDEVTYLNEIRDIETSPNYEAAPGYLVEFPDNYKSWLPKNTFELDYRLISDSEKKLID